MMLIIRVKQDLLAKLLLERTDVLNQIMELIIQDIEQTDKYLGVSLGISRKH